MLTGAPTPAPTHIPSDNDDQFLLILLVALLVLFFALATGCPCLCAKHILNREMADPVSPQGSRAPPPSALNSSNDQTPDVADGSRATRETGQRLQFV